MRVWVPEQGRALALHRSDYCPSADQRSSAGSIASIGIDTSLWEQLVEGIALLREAASLHFPLNSCRWGSCCHPQQQKSSPVEDSKESCGSWKVVLAQKPNATHALK